MGEWSVHTEFEIPSRYSPTKKIIDRVTEALGEYHPSIAAEENRLGVTITVEAVGIAKAFDDAARQVAAALLRCGIPAVAVSAEVVTVEERGGPPPPRG